MENDKGGIHIHMVTLGQFTSPGGRETVMASTGFCEGPGKRISEGGFESICFEAPDFEHLRTPSNVEGFSIAHDGTNCSNGMICIWDDATGKPVGGQYGGVPYVLPEYRGLKLGREIQIRAFETGIKTLNDGSFFSPEGFASRKSAHRFCVERALQQGFEVPENVLEDYTELRAKPLKC